MGPAGGIGMTMGYDPLLMSNMGMNLFGNPYLTNPYTPFGITNNGNSFAGFGTQKYGSPMYSRKRFIPGISFMSCNN